MDGNRVNQALTLKWEDAKPDNSLQTHSGHTRFDRFGLYRMRGHPICPAEWPTAPQ